MKHLTYQKRVLGPWKGRKRGRLQTMEEEALDADTKTAMFGE